MSERRINSPGFSDIPADWDPRLKSIIAELQTAIDLREGRIAQGTNTRFVSIQDLVDAGVVADGAIE